MAVTLRVSSPQSHSLGPNATRVFDGAGTIGRSPGNDWVLPDPDRFVSGQHAAISCESGGYFLTDLSTNGTIVNGEVLPKGGRVRLESGDRVTLGNYEIVVDAGAADGVRQHGVPQHDTPQHGVPLFGQGADRPLDAPAMAGRESSLDPLDFFGPPQQQSRGMPPGAEPDHVPSHAEFFAPPSVHADPFLAERAPPPAAAQASRPAAGGSHIPENWDDTGLTAEVPAARARGLDRQPPFAPGAASSEAADPFVPHASTPYAGAPPTLAEPPVASPTEAEPPFASPGDSVRMPAPARAAAAPRPAPPTSVTAPSLTAPSVAAPSAAQASALDALLRGAGLDPAAVDARTAAALGEVLRVVVDGLLEVLHARAAIKNEFRVAMTTLKPVENNPLKFSASAEDALHNLFVRRGQSYLGPVQAFSEAFDDLKAHQLALMAGMRAAFGALLARFDPERLQEGFDKGLKRSALLDVINKTKYWDLYREMYAELGDDDATFRRLFGDEFAQAYEEQMQRLAASARKRQ